MLLGDMGADVIKVEPPEGEHTRHTGAEIAPGVSASFLAVNRSKRGITLNLADPRGADLLKQLVKDADILIENYTPRVMGNFGLEYPVLREVNPRLIMMSMPGFGGDVSWRDFVALRQQPQA